MSIFFLLINFLTKEYPFECIPFEGIAKIKSFFFIFPLRILCFSTNPTEKPAISNFPLE